MLITNRVTAWNTVRRKTYSKVKTDECGANLLQVEMEKNKTKPRVLSERFSVRGGRGQEWEKYKLISSFPYTGNSLT